MELEREDYVNTEAVTEYFKGKTITDTVGLRRDGNEIVLFFGAESFSMYHSQDCCESVTLEDICGPRDLTGAIFYEIVKKTNKTDEPLPGYTESYTWTFYTIKTSKGYTDFRWYGESNGYYSESVDLGIDKTIKELEKINDR